MQIVTANSTLFYYLSFFRFVCLFVLCEAHAIQKLAFVTLLALLKTLDSQFSFEKKNRIKDTKTTIQLDFTTQIIRRVVMRISHGCAMMQQKRKLPVRTKLMWQHRPSIRRMKSVRMLM